MAMEVTVTNIEPIPVESQRGSKPPAEEDFVLMEANGGYVFTTTAVGAVKPRQRLLVEYERRPDEVYIVAVLEESAVAD